MFHDSILRNLKSTLPRWKHRGVFLGYNITPMAAPECFLRIQYYADGSIGVFFYGYNGDFGKNLLAIGVFYGTMMGTIE